MFSWTSFSAVISSCKLNNNLKRKKILKQWLIAGLVLSFLPAIVFIISNVYFLYGISGLIGVYFGFGAPIFLGYFTRITKDNNRSTTAGFTLFLIGVFLIVSLIFSSILFGTIMLVIFMTLSILSFWKISSVELTLGYRDTSWKKLFRDKTFWLYLLSMSIFLSSKFIVNPLMNSNFSIGFQNISTIISNSTMVISALIFGFLGDKLGRKKIVLTGIFFSALSFSIWSLLTSEVAYITQSIVMGISDGMLYPMFFFTIWGDLSKKGSPEKYYTIGALPLIISIAISYSLGATIALSNLALLNILPFISLFVFAAILPIAYASEILPNAERIRQLDEKLQVMNSLARHDVRNKLSVVNAHTYLLKKKNPERVDIKESAENIERAVDDSVKIFDFVRMYERIGSEELAQIDVGKTVDEATAMFPNFTFRVINNCKEKTVFADSFLRQMFYNFLDNTRKYGQKTTVAKFYFDQKRPDVMQLIYEDDGVGIPAENKSKLFQEGFSTGGSTGFGLYLIKKMMDVYGWSISEEGKQGDGAKFVIRIPNLQN
jgi:signal transduction histidine kinase